ncbi:MAG: DUF2959 domain-containing protein [Phycisphaerales bacterium]
MRTMMIAALGLGVLGASLGGCSTASIKVREAFGQAKREQLVDRVEDARDEQEKTKEQFATTLEEFKSLTGFDGGDLEKTYNKLKRELERSEDRADAVRGKIRNVERVADAMFKEWRSELGEYSSADLRAASEDQLRRTESRYQDLLGAMKRAEAKMDPVLARFNDQVLFLKHNLNARAISSLETTVGALEGEIATLIDEMNASIAEANSFIDEMGD